MHTVSDAEVIALLEQAKAQFERFAELQGMASPIQPDDEFQWSCGGAWTLPVGLVIDDQNADLV